MIELKMPLALWREILAVIPKSLLDKLCRESVQVTPPGDIPVIARGAAK